MKILVTYFSETGNTQRVAEAMAEEATGAGHAVNLVEVAAVTDEQLAGADLVIVGSTCHSSDIASPARDLLSRLPSGGPALAGFMTHATLMPGKTERHTQLYEQWAGKGENTFETAAREKSCEWLGYFHCMGVANPGIEQFIKSTIITDETEWAEYADEMRAHPNDEDLGSARAFVQEVIAKLR